MAAPDGASAATSIESIYTRALQIERDGYASPEDEDVVELARAYLALSRYADYLRVRMMVAVSFLDSETLDKFHEHVAGIDAKQRAAS